MDQEVRRELPVFAEDGTARTTVRQRRWAAWPLLAVLPLAVIPVTGAVRAALGPYFLRSNIDPVYCYLTNSLLIATGHGATHTDHPGTTAQLLGAATIRVMHSLGGREPLPDDVLRRPEEYLAAIHWALVGLFTATLAASGALVYRAGGSLAAAVLVQASPFLTARPFTDLAKVKAEPMLMTIVAVFAALLLLPVLAPPRRTGGAYALALGVVAGLAMATKATFLPLLIVPLAVLPSWWRRLGYLAATAATFAAIAVTATASPGRFLRFFSSYATHTEAYGKGETGVLSSAMLLDRLPRLLGALLVEEWIFVLVVLASLAVVAAVPLARRRRGGDTKGGAAWWLLALLVVAQLASIVMVTKNPVTPLRYLVAAFGMLGANLVLLRGLAAQVRVKPAIVRGAGAVLLLAVPAHLYSQVRSETVDLARARDRALAREERAVAVAATVPCRLLNPPNACTPQRALDFGDQFAGFRFAQALERVYPGTVLYNSRKRSFTSFGRPLASADALAVGPLCAFGAPREDDWPEDVTVEPIAGTNGVVIRLAAATPPPAAGR